MKKSTKMLKKLACLFLVVLMSIDGFAAVVSDNDGSAFITKAEFDSLKNDFQSQLNGYNTSIDTKIDSAIASYLAGVKVAKSGKRASLREGIIWSIGPFDRPRFKHGIPIWDLITGRITFPKMGVSNTWPSRATYFLMISSWGNHFVDKTPIVNSRWGYDDILLKNSNADGALLDGWYGLCGHWVQMWNTNNLSVQWGDPVTDLNIDGIVGGASPQAMWSTAESWYGNWRNSTFTASDTGVWTKCQEPANPGMTWSSGSGRVNYASITKGTQLKWDNNIVAFGPLDYKYFSKEYENQPSNYQYAFLNVNQYGRDEKCYIKLNSYHYDQTQTVHLKDWNLTQWTMPDPEISLTPAYNPWNVSELPGWQSVVKHAHHSYISSTDKLLTNQSTPLYATRGVRSRYVDSGRVYDFNQYVYIQEPRLCDVIQNWNKIGLKMPTVVNNYITENRMTSQLLTLDDKSKAMSLAAGVPIVQLEKTQKITIKGEFRKNCSYVYDATTKKSTLNEGTKDTTDAYVVYAKYSPFNINAMPEDESDLIDISPTVKDSANIGKLTKCRIVRDGDINITFENRTGNEKVVFLKWEKLSNWNNARTTRRTGDATNTDVHVVNTRTDETIAPPTWIYFGGGFAKFDKEFRWENIEN